MMPLFKWLNLDVDWNYFWTLYKIAYNNICNFESLSKQFMTNGDATKNIKKLSILLKILFLFQLNNKYRYHLI